jgi:hypothetical protein
MNCALRALCFLACAAASFAQAPAAIPPASGLETPWEMAPIFQELSAHAGRLLPLIETANAEAWVRSGGASDTYLAQKQSAIEQTKALAIEAKALAATPEKLSLGLQVLLRLQAVDAMVGSLADAVRRYQTAREAQELAKVAAESGSARGRIQMYLVNLATQREKDYEVMDREAQRCRGIVTQAPPRTTRKN